jgi:hypothetical protein
MAEYVNNKKDLSLMQKDNLELEIMKRIELLPKSKANLPYREKRQFVQQEMNKKAKIPFNEVQLDLQNNTIILIDIPKILKFRDEIIVPKILEINDDSLTYEQKLLKVLDKFNSSETIKYDENKEDIELRKRPKIWVIEEENNKFSKYSINSLKDISNDSTNDSSYSKVGSQVSDPLAESWVESKLYDINEYPDNTDIFGSKQDNKNIKYVAYEYPNNLETYYLSISQYLLSKYKMDRITTKEMSKKSFNSKFGLYFCGKDIKEKINKKCAPDEMICKDCMKKNKEYYFLDGHKSLLININGRVCSNAFKDRKFHCYGKFKKGNIFETCFTNGYTCKACEELNNNFIYYCQ